MELRVSLRLFFLSCFVWHVLGTCYYFQGPYNTFLQFNTDTILFSHRSYFQLSFKTQNDSGLLYYTESKFESGETTLDYEGIYIYEGKLHYFIFNPQKYGTGSSRGAHVITDFDVNDGVWHKLEFFRNKEAEVPAGFSGDGYKKVNQTGLTVDGKSYVNDGTLNEMDVTKQSLFIGGHPKLSKRIDQSGKLGAFDGYIKDIEDLLTGKELFPEQPGELRESEFCGEP